MGINYQPQLVRDFLHQQYNPEDQHGTCPHGGLVQMIFLSFYGVKL